MNNKFLAEWGKVDRPETHPSRMRGVQIMEWQEFRKQVLGQDTGFVQELVSNLYAGDVYVLRHSYPADFCERLKLGAYKWGQKMDQSFHQMLEGCPNFHRVVNKDLAGKYSFQRILHHYYFYRWNVDELDLWKMIDERWSILKFLGGFALDEYVKNTPKDGIVDRIHVHHYPSGAGEIETHSDPYRRQRTIMGAQISEKGKDYKTGGLYYVDRSDKKILIDDQIQLGDTYISFPTVHHGVETIDKGTTVDWSHISGRWFLGFYSAESDEVANRHTGYAVKDYHY